ncbi:MAG: DUF2892 domain-containing protein [Bacteroidota bacterium]
MKKNMGTADRIVRILVAIAAVALYATGTVTGALGIVLIVVAVIFAATSTVSFCPLYRLVGIRTCKVDLSANK